MAAALAPVLAFAKTYGTIIQIGATIAGSAIQASQQRRAGEQQQAMYDQQAAQARIQGRTQAINYKQQAADVLRRMNETLATTVARAGQFGDAISGSALALQKFAESEGSVEFGTSIDNAQLALAGAADTGRNLSYRPDALQEQPGTLTPLERDLDRGNKNFEFAPQDELQRL
jgi:hypothetical protein